MKLFQNALQDEAKIVDGKLILSLPNAKNPVVWQMDLHDTKISSFEVNDNKKDGFVLVMKTPGKETIQIAPFENKEQAVQSLLATSKALHRAQKQVSSLSSSDSPQKSATGQGKPGGFLKKIAIFALGAIIIFSLYGYLISMTPRAPYSLEQNVNSEESNAQGEGLTNKTGVPVSADEYLKKR